MENENRPCCCVQGASGHETVASVQFFPQPKFHFIYHTVFTTVVPMGLGPFDSSPMGSYLINSRLTHMVYL